MLLFFARRTALCAVLAATMLATDATAQLSPGKPAPPIKARDIVDRAVDLDALAQADGRKLLIVYFFSPQAGEELAHKLRLLHRRYGGKELEVVAVGMESDEARLKGFAEELGLNYHVVSEASMSNADWLAQIDGLPLTLFVMANKDRIIERVLRGGGQSQVNLLTQVAESFFVRGDMAEAEAVLEQAVAGGEAEVPGRELKGYIYALSGKLDEAEKEFAAIDDTAGLAKVALERGDLERAVELGRAAPSGYGKAVAAEALLRSGEVAEAADAADAAVAGAAADWQRSEAHTVHGRIAQERGDLDTAVAGYREAQALDPHNVVPLSNEAEVRRRQGALEEAATVLERAQTVRPSDDLSAMMLAQVRRQMEEQNDTERAKLVQSQIADLSARFKEVREAGLPAADSWTTRPLVLALLPAGQADGVFFKRAGIEVALQRELESRLQAEGRVQVVDRSVLDQLLQELNLGTSELASADTQRRLGQVLSAGLLGVMEFAQLGNETLMYLRLIDTETTAIAHQLSTPVREDALRGTVDTVVAKVLEAVSTDRALKGLVADAGSADTVLINLGRKHGVQGGQRFSVFAEGDPVEAGGRIIAHKQKKVGTLVVTELQDEYSVCRLEDGDADTPLAKDMKIRSAD